ncbi:hypothetical protein LOTGIDRAFT_235955 [Lottia gigantea]|uniref:Calpain catalytic domain-containing protein n=1 Tax=Lottia gigantea TaxID=225164 RepID=V3ZVX2_LOTGI|nr:hypothetical protein LOTGIDRAFT_235955 [Lottia gigantea]ESO85096.1 hypothetical protein LOTGIDRAFT_235955 [Lottia gigantea]
MTSNIHRKFLNLVPLTMPTNYRNQSYSKIRKDCISKGVLFEDPEFPANNKSLFNSKIDNEIEWKRPKELCRVPKLVVEGVSCDDLNQGDLGNTWFVTACSSLAQEPKLWQKVVTNHKDQEWDDKNLYAGIFKFLFWRFGDWIEVVIDDRLPTKNGNLVFCHSKSRNEFWSALLEKAYAKMYGDYESLESGTVADSLVDFTSGVSEKLETVKLKATLSDPESSNALFTKLCDAKENRALMTCNIQCVKEEVGKYTDKGLVLGHGYNITDVKSITVSRSLQGTIGSSMLYLVRLFNPWGSREWNGAWSDSSEEWKRVAPQQWEKMGVKFQQEGEFWMSFEDLLNHFTAIDICHFVNTSFFSIKKTWAEAILHSEWHHNGRNGGGVVNAPSFLGNPQFLFDINGISDKVMISLEQHDIHPDRQTFGQNLNTIGFHIMKVEENRKYRVHILGQMMFSSEYCKTRSVFGETTLPKGRYVIIPTTAEQGCTGRFMLRLYTGSSASAGELTKEGPTRGCPCLKKHVMVTTITVISVDGLELPSTAKSKESLDPMITIKCEGESIKSNHHTNTTSATYNITGTFYRKKPELPIIVEIENHNVLVNDFLAEGRVDEHGNEAGKEIKCKLYGRKKEAEQVKPGTLSVFIRSSFDLTSL